MFQDTQFVLSMTYMSGIKNHEFMRSITIRWEIKGGRPNAFMYPFFDGVSVLPHVRQDGKNYGEVVQLDSQGAAQGVFVIPANTFRTGEAELVFSESPELDEAFNDKGYLYGYCKAKFTSQGLRQVMQRDTTVFNTDYQEVVQTIEVEQFRLNVQERNEVVELPPPVTVNVTNITNNITNVTNITNVARNNDPIAQTFLVDSPNGVFVHSVDIFFATKGTEPFTVYLTKTDNGYPATSLESDFLASKTLLASQIVADKEAKQYTRFVFDRLVYLEGGKEYAFVCFASDPGYYMHSVKMGEVARETGIAVIENTFFGSIFKSQNKKTWTPDQLEDLKFRINVAKFDIANTGIVNIDLDSVPLVVDVAQCFETTSGSPLVKCKLPYRHGLQVGSVVHLTFVHGNYSGIAHTNLNGVRPVTSVINEYEFVFQAGGNATSTGAMNHDSLQDIKILNPGSGYSQSTTSVSITGGGGSGASADAVVVNGKIVSINITNRGSGYTSTPTITINSSSGGSGAVAVASSRAYAAVKVNTVFNEFAFTLPHLVPGGCELKQFVSYRYAPSNNPAYIPYTQTSTLNDQLNNEVKFIDVRSPGMVISAENAAAMSVPRDKISLSLHSNDAFVSPVVYKRFGYTLQTLTNDANEVASFGAPPDLSLSRSVYLSKPFKTKEIFNKIKVVVNAASTEDTDVLVFVKPILSSDNKELKDIEWIELSCNVARNRSQTMNEFYDYTFLFDGGDNTYDGYQLAIVLQAKYFWNVPRVRNYRALTF